MKRHLIKHLPTLLLAFGFIMGIILLIYPGFSNWINRRNATHMIGNYINSVENIDQGKYDGFLEQAREYNSRIAELPMKFKLSKAELKEYYSLLNVNDSQSSSIMGYIEISSVNIRLPIYHGCDEAVLAAGVGHIAGSSLPIGGESTHCVLSGHRGLPSARLFTDISKLSVGDTFVIRSLNEVLTYEVDQIITVLPEDVESLAITQGEDLCTLVTCTPYGVNSHRLLVRGHRVPNVDVIDNVSAQNQELRQENGYAAVFASILFLLALFIFLTARLYLKKQGNKR